MKLFPLFMLYCEENQSLLLDPEDEGLSERPNTFNICSRLFSSLAKEVTSFFNSSILWSRIFLAKSKEWVKVAKMKNKPVTRKILVRRLRRSPILFHLARFTGSLIILLMEECE